MINPVFLFCSPLWLTSVSDSFLIFGEQLAKTFKRAPIRYLHFCRLSFYISLCFSFSFCPSLFVYVSLFLSIILSSPSLYNPYNNFRLSDHFFYNWFFVKPLYDFLYDSFIIGLIELIPTPFQNPFIRRKQNSLPSIISHAFHFINRFFLHTIFCRSLCVFLFSFHDLLI